MKGACVQRQARHDPYLYKIERAIRPMPQVDRGRSVGQHTKSWKLAISHNPSVQRCCEP